MFIQVPTRQGNVHPGTATSRSCSSRYRHVKFMFIQVPTRHGHVHPGTDTSRSCSSRYRHVKVMIFNDVFKPSVLYLYIAEMWTILIIIEYFSGIWHTEDVNISYYANMIFSKYLSYSACQILWEIFCLFIQYLSCWRCQYFILYVI